MYPASVGFGVVVLEMMVAASIGWIEHKIGTRFIDHIVVRCV